ncbi:Any1p NDAI_0H01470 [Naumovozyma dairenensis CBS 421]|uniref:PQ-loop repeat-containing protein 1 n=1 Tax=Naumovozyma dairenensis (strain ATCC 10597 / BCRC 20456 / CBS 421 / NBRC 0211 / NRRL Y-12639) TaxID=1071378 RepID=G0WEW0_NAUDC|nr:hypothetical protein NDAI_0H01470 [Naumovozyma dairenensis CBS 421]CCD26321.1 hypothetical protein NDAI_0H01470 [Naumovozyma dairenensis CBS 421]
MEATTTSSIATAVASSSPAVTAPNDIISSYLPRVDQFYIPEWLTMQFIANNLISFTPLFSYGTTIISIEKSKTALGFSIDICATMLIASILRVSYYLITPYEITLLRQALVMIFIQLMLLNTSLKYRPDEYKYQNLKNVESFIDLIKEVWYESFEMSFEEVKTKHNNNNNDDATFNDKGKVLSDMFQKSLNFSYKCLLVFIYKFLKFFDPSFKRFGSFWQWNNTKVFWRFLIIFTLIQMIVTFSISKILNWSSLEQFLGSTIGSLGLFIESLLPLPQIAILYKLKSIQGFKLILLVSWLCGDTLKITYLIFGAKNISILFFLFAFFQMSLDFYIGGQYVYYKYYYKDHDNYDDEI